MDIDETVLDNSPYQARLIRDQAQYSDPSWDLWVAEKKAKAVPGAVDFARAAAAKGVTILYLSNRAVHLKDATLANLAAVGMPVASDEVFLGRSEEHTSELQSLMRSAYDVLCLKNKTVFYLKYHAAQY